MKLREKNGKLPRQTDSVRSKCSSWPSLATKAFNNRDTLAYTCAVYRKQRPSHNPLVLIAEMTRSREKYLVRIYAFTRITATYHRKKDSKLNGVLFCTVYQRDINRELGERWRDTCRIFISDSTASRLSGIVIRLWAIGLHTKSANLGPKVQSAKINSQEKKNSDFNRVSIGDFLLKNFWNFCENIDTSIFRNYRSFWMTIIELLLIINKIFNFSI